LTPSSFIRPSLTHPPTHPTTTNQNRILGQKQVITEFNVLSNGAAVRPGTRLRLTSRWTATSGILTRNGGLSTASYTVDKSSKILITSPRSVTRKGEARLSITSVVVSGYTWDQGSSNAVTGGLTWG